MRILIVALVIISCVSACSDGDNCTCAQCLGEGYTYYCPSKLECYSTEFTCKLGCRSGGCVDTKECKLPDACTADQSAACGPNSTCCIDADTLKPFCPPAPDQTCCNWHRYYCPKGYACDPVKSTCLPPNPPQDETKTCKACKWLIGNIKKNGCKFACDLIPVDILADLCESIMDDGLCDWIKSKIGGNWSTNGICDSLGACSSGSSCSCGYCQPSWYGHWCLSIPNKCPASSAGIDLSILGNLFSDSTDSKSWRWRGIPRDEAKYGMFSGWRVPRHAKQGEALRAQNVCLDGICDDQHQGCCLTCAP